MPHNQPTDHDRQTLDLNVNLNVTFALDPKLLGAILPQLAEALQLLRKISKQEDLEMALIDDLASDVEENNSVQQSAITLLQNLKSALDAAGTDPKKLQAIKDSLDSGKQALADAVAANTPAENPPPTA